jgi:hypothetical protein
MFFIRVFSFILILDRFACYSRDYNRSFVFLIFWFLLLLESFTYLDCTAKLVLFGVGFSFAKVRREV